MVEGKHRIIITKATETDFVAIKARKNDWEIRDIIAIRTPEKNLSAIVMRIPLEDSIVDTYLRKNTAVYDIDACRISFNNYDFNDYIDNRVGYKDGFDHVQQGKNKEDKNGVTYSLNTTGQSFDQNGRFPANFILVHGPKCQLESRTKDSLDWNCEEDCPVEQLDNQSGVRISASAKYGVEEGKSSFWGSSEESIKFEHEGYGDYKGGASRFFHQSTSLDEVKEYLNRMLGDCDD